MLFNFAQPESGFIHLDLPDWIFVLEWVNFIFLFVAVPAIVIMIVFLLIRAIKKSSPGK
ncbi:MAG: hypothetical protein LBE35_07965 [Clostridiales bacterium]|jgi:uncharacterized membrane protein (UPF0182 family)|nr:hypothetical protein [Clostridiales bacterium]